MTAPAHDPLYEMIISLKVENSLYEQVKTHIAAELPALLARAKGRPLPLPPSVEDRLTLIRHRVELVHDGRRSGYPQDAATNDVEFLLDALAEKVLHG